MTHPYLILNQGERWMVGDVRKFPRLECCLKMHDNGKLVIHGAGSTKGKDPIWKSRSKARDGPHYAVFKNGQLVVYRGMPDNNVVWRSN